ncbi:MAG: Unknown protein [uncultured Sulfurovum sp.]|uniref:Uncharacterized protein n=1 Tax=uncultured Sulfurovum sp. TaxID=269237 RepID=A0A6S6TQH2_9BACT|nr:MAG: Unknown protein [uncultured Sulfurovum sp.]
MQYHEIKVKVNKNTKPSSFIGSALRGAFGHALKETSCINPSYKCEGCFAKENCLYHEFYEQSNGYRPFRFNVEVEQKNYDFGLVLFFMEGRESDLTFLVSALSLMLNKYGLEKEHFKFPDSTFVVETFSPLKQIFLPKVSSTVLIKSLTPFILKQANRSLLKEINLEDILSSIYKRKAFFEEGKAYAKPSFTPSYELISSKSHYQKTFRRSDAQGKKIPVEGYSIEMLVKNLDQESYELLKYGELVAVGNDTVRGYGRFSVELGMAL